MHYDAECERYYDQEGVTITARGFGQTEAAEFITINDNVQMAVLHELVDYFVHRGYIRGKSIRAATYDWRHGAGKKTVLQQLYEHPGHRPFYILSCYQTIYCRYTLTHL